MPGMQQTTYAKEFQYIHDALAVKRPRNNEPELCRGSESDVGQDCQDQASIPRDPALEMPIVQIDRIPRDGSRKPKSRGRFHRPVSTGRTNREALVARSQTQNSHVTTADPEAVEAQIRKFMERPDLRHCWLPGMLSRISREACEGWQRQARFRASKLSVKIKLDPCKKCQFYVQTAAAPLDQKH
jgi:hypothetical protein